MYASETWVCEHCSVAFERSPIDPRTQRLPRFCCSQCWYAWLSAQQHPARHGHARVRLVSVEYTAWRTMHSRCGNPHDKSWVRYGGRGIVVCERWLSFESFLADMGRRPTRHTLGRINNDGNYEPSNCHWETTREQNRNRSVTRLTPSGVLEIKGRCEHGESQTSVASRFGVSLSTINDVVRGRTWQDIH